MKKVISILVLAVLLIGMMGVTAFSHGGHGIATVAVQQPRYELCTVDGCDIVGLHQHGDAWYCSQTARQCGNYEVCTVAGCTELGLHEHDGVYYRCATSGTGRGCGRWANQ